MTAVLPEIYIEHDNVINKSVMKPVKTDIFQEKC